MAPARKPTPRSSWRRRRLRAAPSNGDVSRLQMAIRQPCDWFGSGGKGEEAVVDGFLTLASWSRIDFFEIWAFGFLFVSVQIFYVIGLICI